MELIAILISFVALAVVIYQTNLTRQALVLTQESLSLTRESLDATKKSMEATNRSTELAIRTMQIEMLPSANWIIQVKVDLERWLKDLKSIINELSMAKDQQDAGMLHAIAKKGLRDPKGLVSRFGVENTPSWLSTIWLSGAQYYYDAKVPQTNLWRKTENEPWFEFIPSFVERCEDSINGIKQLLQMIDDVVPEAYLSSPAGVSDERFLD